MVNINRLNGGNITITTGGSAPAAHEETWYKYTGDTEWRTVNIEGSIYGDSSEEYPSAQIPDITLVEEVEVGTNINIIGDYAFNAIENLLHISIPSTVTSLGYCAFFHCSGLTSVTIPNSVESIGSFAFWYCSGLTSLTIPDSVTSIGASAFYDCSGLTSVTIPDSAASIGERAFSGCSSLASVTITANGGNSANVKQMMIDAGVPENITWNMPS